MERLTNQTNDPPVAATGTGRRPSRLATAVAAIIAAALVGTVVTAIVIGLVTFTLLLVLLPLIVVLLLAFLIAIGRGKLHVYVYRGSARSLRRRTSPSSPWRK